MTRTALFLTALLVACGGKTDDSGSATATPDASCDSLCTTSGFSGGTANAYDHEVNCICDGTGGTVEQADCESTCSGMGWSNADAYDVNACQCNDE